MLLKEFLPALLFIQNNFSHLYIAHGISRNRDNDFGELSSAEFALMLFLFFISKTLFSRCNKYNVKKYLAELDFFHVNNINFLFSSELLKNHSHKKQKDSLETRAERAAFVK